MPWPSDVPASSFDELRRLLRNNRLLLGVAKDHAKDWWTFAEESRGRGLATIFLYFPFAVALAVIAAAASTRNWIWLIALPFSFLAFVLGSPINPGRWMAVVIGVSLLVVGWLAQWSSLLVSGVATLSIYGEMQIYYGLGKRAFRHFLLSNGDGFAKYWGIGIVMLSDARTGRIYSHDTIPTGERLTKATPAATDNVR